MDHLVRKTTMAMAKSTSRRGFLGKLARGAVSAGLGAGFLFGGQRFAYANNCQEGTDIKGCTGWDCADGDVQGCSTAEFGYCSGCTYINSIPSCPSGYDLAQHWTCCCGGILYHCKLCALIGGGHSCECTGGGPQC